MSENDRVMRGINESVAIVNKGEQDQEFSTRILDLVRIIDAPPKSQTWNLILLYSTVSTLNPIAENDDE